MITLVLDASASPQRSIEDCHVWCRPITVDLDIDADGDLVVQLQAEEDT